MSRFQFGLADRGDDADIRAFLRSSSMPGRIELSFLREPDYFAPGGRFGPLHQTIVCRDAAPAAVPGHDAAPRIVGLACRSVRTVHLDGRPGPVGYLSMLRSAERVRSGMLLARGYRYLKQLHRDGTTPCYLTSIAEGNDVALDVLTSNRAGLPHYRPVGRYLTFAIATGSATAGGAGALGGPADFDELVRFLASHGKSRQFYPAFDRSEFGGPRTGDPGSTFAGIDLDDIAVVRDRHGQIVATMALWDQRPFRQTVVRGYDPVLRRARPIYNATARLHRRPKLPAPGTTLDEGYVALTAIEGDDLDVADDLLVDVLRRARARGLDYVLFGCHESDPLSPVANRRSFLTYTTHTFLVTWPEFGPEPTYDRDVPIHLEVGCL